MSRRPNQVSLKDLFTTNPGELLGARYTSDSALDSASHGNSQFPYSQTEFFDSQDGQQLPHSQNLSQSPTTRFFNRYMAKGSVIIGRDGSQSQIGRTYSAPTAPKLPSQQQIQLLKARTQEQDERDLWNSLVSGIRECSAEVRVAVACLKESTQLGIGSTECQLTTFSEKIQSSLEKNQSVIVETLANRDNARTKETEFQQQLAIKNARIEELERQIKKMSQEKQDVTIASLQSTCEDLCCKITESLESFFCRNQNALTRLEVVQEKHDQLAVDQMKQYLQQNFQDQKEYMKSLLEGFKTLNKLQNETMQMQNGILTSEVLKSLHIVQENQLKGFEELLIHQMKELLEKKELNQKELFEEQQQRLSAMQQEQRQEMLKCLQSEVNSILMLMSSKIQNSHSEQKKQFLSIIEDCMSQEKNRYFQLLKELETVNRVNQRCGKELEDNKDPVSSKPLSRGRIDVICPELAKNMNKNDFPSEEGLQILPIHIKAQPDTPSVQPTKRMACDGDAKKLPSTASLYEFPVDPAPAALSCTQANWDRGLVQTSRTTSNSSTSFKGDKPVNRGKLQLTEVVDPKFVSPLPSGYSRSFTGHSYVCNDSKVNPSPVALVIPQVQAPKPLQLERNNTQLVAGVVQSTAHKPALTTGTTMTFSGMKSGSFATPVLIPAALPVSVARAKALTTSPVLPSSISSIAAFAKDSTPQARASSMKTPRTKERICKFEMQQSDSPTGGRKISKKRRGKRSHVSQSRKRARKQPIVEVRVSDRHSTSANMKLVTNSNRKTDKITAKNPNHKQSVICQVLSPMTEVFDFHSDTSAGSDDDFPVNNKRFLNCEAQLSTYSRENFEGRRMTRSTFDISKRQPAPKFPDFSETGTKAGDHGLYSICSKSSNVGKTRGLPASHKEKCSSANLENNSCLKRNPSSKDGYCSSSTSSSPCWSIGDILKLSEV